MTGVRLLGEPGGQLLGAALEVRDAPHRQLERSRGRAVGLVQAQDEVVPRGQVGDPARRDVVEDAVGLEGRLEQEGRTRRQARDDRVEPKTPENGRAPSTTAASISPRTAASATACARAPARRARRASAGRWSRRS